MRSTGVSAAQAAKSAARLSTPPRTLRPVAPEKEISLLELFWVLPVLALALAGALLLGRRRLASWARVRRARLFLHRHTQYRVIRLLGLGREGIVFQVANAAGGTLGNRLALKLLDSRDGRGFSRRIDLHRAIGAAVEEAGLRGWVCLPHVHELTVVEADGHAIPIEVMEFVEGKTLKEEALRRGLRGWALRDRLLALDELLYGLGALSARGVSFVHIDADNLMVTPDRRLKLIDLSGFRLKPLTPRRRRRIFRRIARTTHVLAQDRIDDILAGRLGAPAAELFGKLEIYRTLPKGSVPPPEKELHSVSELRENLSDAFALEAGGGTAAGA